jgi:hypothetical protein
MDYIIGDVHGETIALKTLVNEIMEQDSDANLCFVGDYVDRGSDSRGTIDYLLTLPNKQVCRGNHDDVFDKILHSEINEAVTQALWFMNFGMVDTLKSYDVSAETMRNLVDAYEAMGNKSPDSKETMFDDDDESENESDQTVKSIIEEIRAYIPDDHKKFIRDLPRFVLQDDFFMIHAHCSIGHSPEAWIRVNAEDGLWGRFSTYEIGSPKRWQRKGYFGHTPTKAYNKGDVPINGNQMTLVDTGSVFGGALTAWNHQTEEIIQVDSKGNLIG